MIRTRGDRQLADSNAVEIDVASVVEDPADSPRLRRLYSIRGIASLWQASPSLIRREAKARGWTRYRIKAGPDPRRWPVRYDERDVGKLIVLERGR